MTDKVVLRLCMISSKFHLPYSITRTNSYHGMSEVTYMTMIKTMCFFLKISDKQEAHGPRFAHLSDIATADMQTLCNIFPILSSQLMKISSFEQFLVLKKNIWAWQSMEHDHLNKLSITFQQKDQCEIWWKLAKWFLKNRDFIHVNSTVAGKYYKYKPDDGHLRFPIRTILTTVDLQVTSILSI